MSNLTFFLIGAAVSAALYVVAYVYYHYEFVVHSRDIRLIRQIRNGSYLFECIFISNAILQLTPEGDESSFWIWLLCFSLGFLISGCAAFILGFSCRKIWPETPEDDRLIYYEKIPAVLSVMGNLVLAALEIGFAIFFLSPFVTGKTTIADNPLLAIASFVVSIAGFAAAIRILRKVFRK